MKLNFVFILYFQLRLLQQALTLTCETPVLDHGYVLLEGSVVAAGMANSPGVEIRLVCNDGFYLTDGADSAFCLGENSWLKLFNGSVIHNFGKCKSLESCANEPHFVVNGVVVGTGSANGSRRDIYCFSGFVIVGNNFTICENGHWSQAGYCMPGTTTTTSTTTETTTATTTIKPSMNCPFPTIVPFGFYNEFDSQSLEPGSTRMISCFPGYHLVGKEYVLCQDNGTWTESGRCMPIPVTTSTVKTTTTTKALQLKCPLPPIAIHGYYSMGFSSPGSRRTLICFPDFEVVGSSFIVCLLNGTWSKSGSCQPKSKTPTTVAMTTTTTTTTLPNCPFPDPVPNGFSFYSSLDSDSLNPSRTVQIECYPGYILYGANLIICQSNGSWTAAGACEWPETPPTTTTEPTTSAQILCPKVLSVPNGHVEGDNRTPGSMMRIHCNDGYEIVGSAHYLCFPNATWSESGICAPITLPISTTTAKTFKTTTKMSQMRLDFRIFNSMFKNNTNDALKFLSEGASNDYRGRYETSAFYWAARHGNLLVVQKMAEKLPGVVNVVDEAGRTPLLAASVEGHFSVVKFLVENGADVNAKANRTVGGIVPGDTAFIEAASKGHLAIVEYLLENGANLESRTSQGQTALIGAVWSGNIQLVSYLLENGADMNVQTKENVTALMIAVVDNDLEIVKLLVINGIDVEARNKYNSTALLLATIKSNFEVAIFLVESGSNVNATNKFGDTALHWAVVNSGSDLTRVLIQAGCNINAKNANGTTALMLAVVNNNIEMSLILLRNRANVRAVDKYGNTALILAGRVGSLPMVQVLLRHGARVNVQNSRGETPVSVAIAAGWWHIANFLYNNRVQ